MKVVAVIPARYGSQRLPGKPLLEIGGHPMIYYPYKQAMDAQVFDEVIIATDDDRIAEVAINQLGAKAIMTSKQHQTGTDRVAEVASKIDADVFVNIQGDEIGIQADALRAIVAPLLEENDIQVTNLISRIEEPSDLINAMVVKVSFNKNKEIMYYTRAPIPYPKSEKAYVAYRQIGLYGFHKDFLLKFSKMEQSPIELIEGVELLRVLENGYKVKAVLALEDSFDVDTYDDLIIARNKFEKQN